jgi:hypothetical protein
VNGQTHLKLCALSVQVILDVEALLKRLVVLTCLVQRLAVVQLITVHLGVQCHEFCIAALLTCSGKVSRTWRLLVGWEGVRVA